MGSRVSSGFVRSCMSPSQLVTVAVSPRGRENGEQEDSPPARQHVVLRMAPKVVSSQLPFLQVGPGCPG